MNEMERARERRIDRTLALAMWGGFVRCPTTGRILEYLQGDDKVLCGCGCSNPAVPSEQTHRTGVHIVRFLKPASVDEYLDQRDADKERRPRRP